MTETIMALAGQLYPVEEEQEGLLRLLCGAAEEELESRLKEGLTPTDCGSAFLCAAAFLAAADLIGALGGEETFASFSAGNVSLSGKSAKERRQAAETLRTQAERLMAPYLPSDTFAFQGVQG